MNDLCNNTYRDLCAKLGELHLQKDHIDRLIHDITAQITLLNALAPQLNALTAKQEIKHE